MSIFLLYIRKNYHYEMEDPFPPCNPVPDLFYK